MLKVLAITVGVLLASVGFAAALARWAVGAELVPTASHTREVEFVLVVVNNRLGLVTMQDYSSRRTCMFAKEHVERETAPATLSTTKADCLTR